MIPKIIHYCWFGRNPKTKLADKCIKSWQKKCPDYKIIEWNEDNFDISSCPLYVRQAYENKKWAFLTDYVRLKVVHDNGGVYLDTDVELLKSLDCFSGNKAWFGFEGEKYINTGEGFGAEKGHPILREMLAQYEDIPFVLPDGSLDLTPCTRRNTEVFLSYGLKPNNKMQILKENILILPSIYLCPIDYLSQKRKFSFKTVSIHHFAYSWKDDEQKKTIIQIRKNIRRSKINRMRHRILHAVLGEKNYLRLKKLIKGK